MNRLVAMLLLSFPASMTVAGQTRPADSVDQSKAQPDAQAPRAEAPLSVAEAVRAAIEAMDRPEAAGNLEARQAIVEEVNGYIKQVLAQEPGNPWQYYLYGCVSAVAGRPGDARDQLVKFVETREGQNEWRAHKMLGDLYVEVFPRLARPHYQKAAVLKPDEPGVLKGMSGCMYRLVDYDQAIDFAREAVRAGGGKNVEHVSHLARMLTARKHWAQARSEAASALELAKAAVREQPGALSPVKVLSEQYRLLMDIAQARLNEEADVAEHYVELARLMRERIEVSALLSNYERLRVLERGVSTVDAKASPALLEAYAVALAEVGREAEAVAEFERALTINPNSETALEWLSRLRPPPPKPDPSTEE